jgi:PAS domain S-box-containing protein
MRHSDGDPIGVVSVSVDITGRKQAQQRLQESEEKYRELGESISDIFFGLDPDLRITYWNKASEILTGVPRETATGAPVTGVIPPFCTDQTMDRLRDVMRTKRPLTFETRLALAGHDLFFEITIYPAVSGLSVVARDVTERHRAEEAVEASLREKEALLKEIHHRVKNNLQIISSLLSLQSQQIRNRKALDALTESQARVRSMALIHEQLYQSQDLAHIDFSQYVRDLAAHLFRTYVTQGPNVRLIVDVRNVFLDADHAIACGMIINELVSNALKHAFAGGLQGTLRIATEWEDEEVLRLVVADSGRGIPASVDHTNTPSLGLKLVRMLADQLKGTVELSRKDGTAFTVRFSTKPVRRT